MNVFVTNTRKISTLVSGSHLTLLFFLLFLKPIPAWGVGVYVDEDGQFSKQVLKIPYGFWNEKFGFAGAYVYGVTGYPAKQSALIGTAMAGTEGSAALFLLGRDLPVYKSSRWFLDAAASISYLAESDVYINGNMDFSDERAGSNNSSSDNFVQGEGWDNLVNLRFKYLLPLGHGKNEIISTYRMDKGVIKKEDVKELSWNPLTSGKTFFEITPFYRLLEITGDDIEDREIKTNGFETAVYWDNRDFAPNPSSGNSLLFKATRDFGWLDSNDSWTSIEIEFDKYFSLGESKRTRQRVIAFDFWTANSPSWEVEEDDSINHRPPPFAGATLGGLFRLRGYPAQRFNDKAAIYYGSEFRVIPKWNPFDNWTWLQKHVGVEWIQVVPFAELGRVAPSWQLDELHEDMKWSTGLGLRLWAKGLVVRVDTSFSEEGVGIQMMVNHPFQF